MADSELGKRPGDTLSNPRQAKKQALRKKTFKILGPIAPNERSYFYNIDDRESNQPLLHLIAEGHQRCIMLPAPNGSGRTTKLFTLMEQLKNAGFACAYACFANFTLNGDESLFWKELSQALSFKGTAVQFDSKVTFIEWLSITNKENFGSDQVVLIFDDIDQLYRCDSLRHQLLGALGILKPIFGATSCLMCCIGVCQYDLTDSFQSPFDVNEALLLPEFTEQQVNRLFTEFAADRDLKLDPRILSDIYRRTAGRPGLVNFCGRQLQVMVEQTPGAVTYSKWIKFALMELPLLLETECPLFSAIRSIVRQESSIVLKLLQSPQPSSEFEKTSSIQTLREVGAVAQHQSMYKIASPMIWAIAMETLCALLYGYPNTAFPLKPDGNFNTTVLIREMLPFFNKKSMANASSRAGNTMTSLFPSTACYHAECYFVLSAWARKHNGRVVGNIHRLNAVANGEFALSNFERYDLIVSFGFGKVCSPTLLIRIISNTNDEVAEMNINQACMVGMALGATQSIVLRFTVDEADELLSIPSAVDNNIIHIRHNRAWTRAKIGSQPFQKIVQY